MPIGTLKLTIPRYQSVIEVFLEKESHLRLPSESPSWTRPVGSVPLGAITVVYIFKAQHISHERPESSCSRKQQCTSDSTGNIPEDATLQPEQTEAILDDRSMIWDIELENGILPSDSSSFAWETTVVIDTRRNWNDQEGIQQSLQPAMESRGGPRSIATRRSDEHSPYSLRVRSRFFSSRVSDLSPCGFISASRTPAVEWEGHLDREPEVSTWNDLVDCHCLDVGCGCTPSWETDSFLGDDYGVHTPGTLNITLKMAGLTTVDKLIKKGEASGTVRKTSKPHSLGHQTPRTIARSVIYHLGLVVTDCQIGIHPNRFTTFLKGGDYSGGCEVFSCVPFLDAAS